MHIALDAMGGDSGPEELIAGATLAVKQAGVQITIVGDQDLLQSHLDKTIERAGIASSLNIVHASEVVDMDEHPVDAIRRKKDSSIMVAFELARLGKVDAVVSAGNSGATMASAIKKLGRLKHISRKGRNGCTNA